MAVQLGRAFRRRLLKTLLFAIAYIGLALLWVGDQHARFTVEKQAAERLRNDGWNLNFILSGPDDVRFESASYDGPVWDIAQIWHGRLYRPVEWAECGSPVGQASA